MAPSNNPYKDLDIDRTLVRDVVEGLGADEYQYLQVGTLYHMCFRLNGKSYRISVFENKGLKTTLSPQKKHDADYSEVFTMVANAIKNGCAHAGGGGQFNISLPRFDSENITVMLDFLKDQQVTVESDNSEHNYRIVRLLGRHGDKLTLKYFTNGTLQIQGRRAMLAASVLDFLTNVLSFDDAVNAQLDTYRVPVRLDDIRLEVEGRLPVAFPRVSGVAKAQLATAVALSKLDMELPDYTPIAFPALKALEGFVKTELELSGFDPAVIKNFGEYFEEKPGFGYRMREVQAAHAGEPAATLFGNCYKILHDQRHSLAHLGTSDANTRTLPNMGLAHEIVTAVMRTVEDFCTKLPR
jgi:hypothetical protein